jgi:hypothetical protein
MSRPALPRYGSETSIQPDPVATAKQCDVTILSWLTLKGANGTGASTTPPSNVRSQRSSMERH